MEEDINVGKIIHDANRRTNKVVLRLRLEIASINDLLKVLEKVGRISNVISARRTASSL